MKHTTANGRDLHYLARRMSDGREAQTGQHDQALARRPPDALAYPDALAAPNEGMPAALARPRLLTPSSTGLRPFPKKAAYALGAGLLVGVVTTRAELDLIKVLAFLVTVVAACGIGGWAEQRIFHGLVGLTPFKRLTATLFVPLVLLVVATPLAGLLGAPFAIAGDRGLAAAAGIMAGLWTAFMAVGTVVMVGIDVVVSAMVKDFRSRVQLAVLGLLAVVVTMSIGFIALGRLVSNLLVARMASGDIPEDLTVNLGDRVLQREQIQRLIEVAETTDFLPFVFVLVGAVVTLPSVLSATGKLADAVMERLHPLSEAIEEVTQGRLDLRVEEGGSRDFVRITQGFNRMVQSLADTLADLDGRNRDLAELNRATSRFVPFQFLELLDKESIREIRRGDQIELDISVMFADIRGFTTMAEAMGPEATFGFINRYLGHMEAAIHREQGFINDVFGDGIMALFHVGADAAVRASLGMLEALEAFNRSLAEEGQPSIRIGIGINSGPLMLGTIGGQDRLSCTVIGDPANTASRTEGMTKLYDASLLITEGTYQRLADPSRYRIREIDLVKAKGKAEAIAIYEVLDGEPPDRRGDKITSGEDFTAALARYRTGDFEGARTLFDRLVHRAPLDGAARLYAERSRDRLEHPDDAWDGITRLDHK